MKILDEVNSSKIETKSHSSNNYMRKEEKYDTQEEIMSHTSDKGEDSQEGRWQIIDRRRGKITRHTSRGQDKNGRWIKNHGKIQRSMMAGWQAVLFP